MANPTDISGYFFRFRCYNVAAEEYYHFSCGPGDIGWDVAQRFLDVTGGDPTVSEYVIEYVPEFAVTLWDFNEASLPSDPESYTWLFLSETDMITGYWQPYGQAMADAAAGFALLHPIIAPMRNYSGPHVRNVALGFTPLVTGWTAWEL